MRSPGHLNQDSSASTLGLRNVWAPRLRSTGTTVDRGKRLGAHSPTVRLDNRSGQADAAGVVFKVPLPAGTSFVSGSFTLDGTKNTSANPVTGVAVGTVAVGDVHTVTFQLHVDAIPTPPAPAKIDVAPAWSYTFISCAGQPAQPGTFATNTAVTGLARIDATKEVTPSSSQPDQILSYSITLSNTGTAPSSGTLVNDAIPAGTVYVPGSTTLNGTAVADKNGTSPLVVGMLVSTVSAAAGVLLPGGGAVVRFQVRVAPSTTTPVVNTAVIDPDGPGGPVPPFQRAVTTAITPQADLSVTKAGPSTAVAGTSITYTINVGNAGPSIATAVSLTDPTPAGLTLVSVTGACTILPCSLGDLASGAPPRTVTVTFAIPGTYTTPDPIVNTASVTSTTADPSPGNNSTSASTALNTPVADLRITNTNGVTSVVPGTATTYTITVTNLGPSTATNAVVTDLFPAVLTGVTWTCAAVGGAVCGSPAGSGNIAATVTVPVGGMLTFTATGLTSSAATGTLVNTVTAVPAAGTSDPNPASATDSDPITLQADLSVTKTGPPTVALGGDITYTIHVANAGPSAATNVTISDPFPPGVIFVSTNAPCQTSPCNIGTLAAGETGTARVTFNVPVGFTGTTVSNTARITSDTIDPNSSNNESTTQATVIRDADVGLVKSVTPDAGVVDDQIKFILTAFNDGPAAASGVVVTDPAPGLSFVQRSRRQVTMIPPGAWTVGRSWLASAELTLVPC